MRRLNIAFALLGVMALGAFAGVLLREGRSEWRRWQRQFRLLEAQTARATSSGAGRAGIQQVVLPDLKREDRCITCHLGIDDPGMVTAEQPFRTHPGDDLDRHPVERFGCTVCHGGQGLATTVEAAHGRVAHWDDPLLPGVAVEARCGVCHLERSLTGAPNLSAGRRIIDEYNCQACHDIPGFSEEKFLGPSWDEVGLKVTRGWLRTWLKDPHSYLERPHMPRFDLADDEREALVEFLLSVRSRPLLVESAEEAAGGDAERGGVLFRESRCITCHSVAGKGGSIGPDLAKVADKARPDWLFSFISNPHFYQPNTPMPKFNFTREEVRHLVAFIFEEFTEAGLPPPDEAPEAAALEALRARGEAVFRKHGCLSCHELEGYAPQGRPGPDLTTIGARLPADLSFGEPRRVPSTLSAWIHTKVQTPKALDPNARMPDFSFTDLQAAQVTLALLSLRPRPPEAYRSEAGEVATAVPQGRAGEIFRKYRCLSCHQIGGRGGTISRAPLDNEGSQVQRAWLVEYMQAPYAVRVFIPERMPKLKITVEEAELVADYMGLVFVDDSIPTDLRWRFEPGDVERGAALYESRGCGGCHILGQTGGYVGPQLNSTGVRLQPGWVFSYLLDPRRFVPDTLHPDYRLTEEDARALAAHLDTWRSSPR